MKKYISIFAAALAAISISSCRQDNPDGSQYAPVPQLELSVGVVQFTYDGGKQTITADTKETVTATSDRDWLAVESINGSSITLNAQARADESLETRYAVVTIKAGNAQKRLQVFQFGLTSDQIWKSSYDFAKAGGTLELKYRQSGSVFLDVEGGDWLDAVSAEGKLTITVAANATGIAREGIINWRCADVSRTIAIHQAGK